MTLGPAVRAEMMWILDIDTKLWIQQCEMELTRHWLHSTDHELIKHWRGLNNEPTQGDGQESYKQTRLISAHKKHSHKVMLSRMARHSQLTATLLHNRGQKEKLLYSHPTGVWTWLTSLKKTPSFTAGNCWAQAKSMKYEYIMLEKYNARLITDFLLHKKVTVWRIFKKNTFEVEDIGGMMTWGVVLCETSGCGWCVGVPPGGELAHAGLLQGAVKTPPATPHDLSLPASPQGTRHILHTSTASTRPRELATHSIMVQWFFSTQVEAVMRNFCVTSGHSLDSVIRVSQFCSPQQKGIKNHLCRLSNTKSLMTIQHTHIYKTNSWNCMGTAAIIPYLTLKLDHRNKELWHGPRLLGPTLWLWPLPLPACTSLSPAFYTPLLPPLKQCWAAAAMWAFSMVNVTPSIYFIRPLYRPSHQHCPSSHMIYEWRVRKG